ncbi:Membrane protein [Lasiodiplodia theobromae]|uniref:Membrane protein n=1 Tax=Lasiodiplodia theobromae TaxID=45133 RepID=UPI0015C2F22A|nr:Membrane protein [Lasiodiplodia theobromae]KAF4541506.1 Membrane protein [Lasiodiplodia theobromae]
MIIPIFLPSGGTSDTSTHDKKTYVIVIGVVLGLVVGLPALAITIGYLTAPVDTDDFSYNNSKNNNSSKTITSSKGFNRSKNINDSKHFDGPRDARPFKNSERFDTESTPIQYAPLPEQSFVTHLPAPSLRRFHRQTHHEGWLDIQ